MNKGVMKARLVHGDMFASILEADNQKSIVAEWYVWHNRYEDIIKVPDTSINHRVRKIQAWHALCACTALLKEMDLFDVETQKPAANEAV